MKKRQFKDREKFEIVLAGHRAGMSVAEICARYEIHQTQYYTELNAKLAILNKRKFF
jgi:transposase-like protein